MSTYANYSSISTDYDQSRSAVASHLYVGQFLTCLKKPLKDIHLLDAGCGTGNYAFAMLEAGVGKVSLCDASEGILEKAREKLEPFVQAGRQVDIRRHYLPTLPYPDETFDVVMFNNVLHHLDADPDYPNALKAMQEAHRVLKKGGLMANQIAFPHQVLKGYWFFRLAPEALETYASRYISRADFEKFLATAGFEDLEIVVPTSILVHSPSVYSNEDGPLDPVVRQSDSFYHSVGSKELQEAQELVKRLKKTGGMKNLIEENDKQRSEIGQLSLVYTWKPNQGVSRMDTHDMHSE